MSNLPTYTTTGGSGTCEDDCNCPGCSPAGDLFMPPSEVNPRRRIIRARRPPQAQADPNLSSAIGFLQQANNNNPSSTTATATRDTQRSGEVSDSDDESMPPLEDIANTAAANPATSSTARRGRNNGSSNRTGNRFGALADNDSDSDGISNGLSLGGGGGATATGSNNPTSASTTRTPFSFTRPTPASSNPGLPGLGLGDAMNAIGRMEQLDDDDSEEDDDDDSGPYHPSQMFAGFLNHMSDIAARRSSRVRTKENLCSRIRPDDDEEDSDEGDLNEECGTARCAACFRSDEPTHKWRRLVTLPCCGTKGREEKSSTRFCAACILKLAVTRADSANTGEYRSYDDEPDEYPVRKFYSKSVQSDNRRFCECPRCRDVLLVKIKGLKTVLLDDSEDDDSDCGCDCSDCEREREEKRASRLDSKTAKSISIHVPSFKAKCWYIGRKKGLAKLMWKISLLHHNLLSFEALGGDDCRGEILKLAGYGIIKRVPGKRNTNVYRIDKDNQTNLIKFFKLPKKVSEKVEKSEMMLLTELQTNIIYAAWRHLRDEYRIDRSLRLMNRLFFVGLHSFGYLPPLPLSIWQELVVTGLVLFSTALILQFVCILAVYALVFFGVGLSVCRVLRHSNNIKSVWWQVIVVSYVVYKVNKIFYESEYLKWSVFITPKAIGPLKKLLWG